MTKLDVTYVGKGKDGEDVYRVGKTVLDALAKADPDNCQGQMHGAADAC
jgi:hypothetical protein